MYNFGQFRKTQLDSYSTPMTMELGYQQNRSADGITAFQDACGNLSGDNILDSQNSYYLRFGVQRRSDSEQKFQLKLRNTSVEEDNEQLIQEFTLSRGSGTTYFEVLISPNATYDQIFWELQRKVIDYQIENPDDTPGRKMVITVNNGYFTKLINVVNVLRSTYPNLGYLSKIGVQGPPSLLMCINREPIRIGNSGIYEINNGIIHITSISFVPQSTSDYFIMDFEY